MSRKENTCPTCGNDSSDSKHVSGYCRKCSSVLAMKYQKDKKLTAPFKQRTWRKKSECTKKGIEYDLTEEYLESIWTGSCPIFEVPLELFASNDHPYSPNLDRIDPNKGYTKGNVQWMSARANRLKNNMTKEETEKLYKWMVK